MDGAQLDSRSRRGGSGEMHIASSREQRLSYVYVNATPTDRDRLATTLDALKGRGIEAIAWPETDLDSWPVLTVWSKSSVHDEIVVARAEQAMNGSRHVPIQIDDVEPLIGFRQLQTSPLRDLSSRAADALYRLLNNTGPAPTVLKRRIEWGWVDNILCSAIFGIVAYLVTHTLRTKFGIAASFPDVFVVPAIGAMLLFSAIVRQPRVFTGKEEQKVRFGRMLFYDLITQATAYGAAVAFWITSSVTDSRMLGSTNGTGWEIPAITAAALAAGITTRWIVVLAAHALWARKW